MARRRELRGQAGRGRAGSRFPVPRGRPGVGLSEGGLAPIPAPPPGQARFRAVDEPELGLIFELGEPVLPKGYGGHDVTDRPGRVGLTSYRGRPPLTLPIELLLDRWSEQKSIEKEITALERMMGVGLKLRRPPILIIEGFGIPHSYTRDPTSRYVLTGDPEWKEVRYREPLDGHRCYALITVNALRLTEIEKSAEPETDAERRAGGRARKFHTVAKGARVNTVMEIARHYREGWAVLNMLNPKLPSDPDKPLKPGTRVRVK